MLRAPHQALALVFGVGLVRWWPGTFGTLAGFAVHAVLRMAPTPARAIIYLVAFALSVWACARTGRDLGAHDHNAIVVDETLAMALALEFLPQTIGFWIAGFLLFRLFDVVKPWPANIVDRRCEGGLFVMLDDLIAALYTVLVLQLFAGLV